MLYCADCSTGLQETITNIINNVITGVCLVVGTAMILSVRIKRSIFSVYRYFYYDCTSNGKLRRNKNCGKVPLWIVFPIVFDRIFSTVSLRINNRPERPDNRLELFLCFGKQLTEAKKSVLSIFPAILLILSALGLGKPGNDDYPVNKNMRLYIRQRNVRNC